MTTPPTSATTAHHPSRLLITPAFGLVQEGSTTGIVARRLEFVLRNATGPSDHTMNIPFRVAPSPVPMRVLEALHSVTVVAVEESVGASLAPTSARAILRDGTAVRVLGICVLHKTRKSAYATADIDCVVVLIALSDAHRTINGASPVNVDELSRATPCTVASFDVVTRQYQRLELSRGVAIQRVDDGEAVPPPPPPHSFPTERLPYSKRIWVRGTYAYTFNCDFIDAENNQESTPLLFRLAGRKTILVKGTPSSYDIVGVVDPWPARDMKGREMTCAGGVRVVGPSPARRMKGVEVKLGDGATVRLYAAVLTPHHARGSMSQIVLLPVSAGMLAPADLERLHGALSDTPTFIAASATVTTVSVVTFELTREPKRE